MSFENHIEGENAFNAALRLLDALGIPYDWEPIEKEHPTIALPELFQTLTAFRWDAYDHGVHCPPLRKATLTAVPAGKTEPCRMVLEEYVAEWSQTSNYAGATIHVELYKEGERPDFESDRYLRVNDDEEEDYDSEEENFGVESK